MPPSRTEDPPVGERLRRSSDYARVQKLGRRIRSEHLLLVVSGGSDAGSRFGLTVSRKVGNAVTRNRIKRWLREAVRAVPGPRGGPWDLVFIPRAEAIDAGFFTLKSEVDSLFSRVR